MTRLWKRWIYPLAIILSLFGVMRLYYHLTDDFRLANVTYQLPFDPPWHVPTLNHEEHEYLAEILKQKFSYIGKGAQCYAFVSEDQQFVLKFFKFKHLKPNGWIELLPSIPPFAEYKKNCIERKQRKLIGVFNGYDLAYRENREGSELLYLHLLPTQNLKLQAKVMDKMGWERTIDLDGVVFLIQRKGETLRSRLRHLLDGQQLQEAKQAVASILEMYISEYKRGIYDHDHGVLHNTGFVGNRPFHLDVGKLNKDERMRELEFYKRDFEQIVWKMDVWMKNSYPQYYPEFSPYLAQEYQKWTGEALDKQNIDPKHFKKMRALIGL
jgi:hypothetical protein